jgi:hypothetical protein
VGALRGAAVLYRATVEEVCTAAGSSGANLHARIEGLAAKGAEADLITDLHEARLLGNWAIHEGLEFSADEVADVAQLIADAVAVLFVVPEERRRMRLSRAERRDARRSP